MTDQRYQLLHTFVPAAIDMPSSNSAPQWGPSSDWLGFFVADDDWRGIGQWVAARTAASDIGLLRADNWHPLVKQMADKVISVDWMPTLH